jgi:hypothetical protein
MSVAQLIHELRKLLGGHPIGIWQSRFHSRNCGVDTAKAL